MEAPIENYYDKYGRVHDKPVTASDPFPCNNTFTYSAYASKVGLNININPEVMIVCSIDRTRHLKSDNVTKVPISREEILGLCYLGYTDARMFEGTPWMFNPKDRPIPKLSTPKLIAQALDLIEVKTYYKDVIGVDVKRYDIKLKHRNYFWQNNLDQIYRFAFSVPLQDRYSILKWSRRFKFYRPDHLLYAGISMIDRLGKPNGMRYLKYGGEKNMRAMITEFPADHPVRVKVGL